MPTKYVERLTQLSSAVLQGWVDAVWASSAERAGGSARVIVAHASELAPAVQDSIFELFCENMRDMYVSEGLWDAPAKRAELFDAASRFVLVYGCADHGSVQRRSTRLGAARTPALRAFLMWRFDLDDTTEDDKCVRRGTSQVEVSYWYATP